MLHSRDFFMRLGQGARHITATDDRKDKDKKDKKEDKDDNDNTGDNVNGQKRNIGQRQTIEAVNYFNIDSDGHCLP